MKRLKHLEKILETPYLGIISFIRHGEKTKEGQLSESGKKQARELGQEFKQMYKNHQQKNIFIRTSSSNEDRTRDTINEMLSIEPKYNKPTIQSMDVKAYFSDELMKTYVSIAEKEGELSAFNWFLDSQYGENIAKELAYTLISAKEDSQKIERKNLKFHYFHGTHETLTESLLKRIIITKENKIGFDNIEEIGGGLQYAEPINFILDKDKTYKVEMRNKIYEVDMDRLENLASQYSK